MQKFITKEYKIKFQNGFHSREAIQFINYMRANNVKLKMYHKDILLNHTSLISILASSILEGDTVKFELNEDDKNLIDFLNSFFS